MRRLILGITFLTVLGLGTGCGSLPGGAAATPKATPRAVKAPDRPTAVVKRGSIVETIKLLGRVAAVREGDLYFREAGRIRSIAAEVGQEITAGQVLAEQDTGDLTERMATAQVNLETAQVKLQQADARRGQAALQRKSDLAAAALAVQQAEAGVAKAESELVAVKAGPSHVETAQAAVRDAEAALEAARRNLVITQNSPTVSRNVSDRQDELNWYELNYAEQKRRFERGEIDQGELERHWNNVLAARERYETAKMQAADALAQAESTVAQAEDKLRKAQIDLAAKQALPPDAHIKEAERAVSNAQLTLEKARLDLALKQSANDDEYEYKLLVKNVDQAKAALDELKAQLENARLTAPFAGKVTAVRGKIGDQVSAYQILVSIADPTELEVRGELMDADLARVAPGQEVALTVDALPGMALKGTILATPTGLSAQTSGIVDRTVRIKVDWPQSGAELGMLTRATITTQRKDNVLIVPARAVKTVGKRRFVEYFDGTLRRSANVELGVITDTEAEVVSGLSEGQTILAGQ